MADYLYHARDAHGALKTGEISATSEEQAAEMLREHQLILTKLSPKKESSLDLARSLSIFKRVSMKDRVIFTRQLSTMVKSGLPIVQALHILSEQTSNKYFQETIQTIAQDIEGGASFSTALAKYPSLFDKVYINMARSGEASGQLDDILNRLATQQEKSYQLAKKVRGALMYPGFVLVAMVAATILMMIVVIPPLKTIFSDAGAKLPFATRMLIALSDSLLAFWYAYIVGAVAAVFGLRYYLRTKSGAATWDRLKLKVPIFGPLFQKIYVARFARTLASLIAGGVPILEALDIVADSVGNTVYRNAIKKAAKDVESGVPLSQPIRANPAFPAMVPQMISVGEQTGKMDAVLEKLANFFEDEVDTMVKNLSTLLEPMLMVVMGVGVGGLMVAILMPIYSLGNVIQ